VVSLWVRQTVWRRCRSSEQIPRRFRRRPPSVLRRFAPQPAGVPHLFGGLLTLSFDRLLDGSGLVSGISRPRSTSCHERSQDAVFGRSAVRGAGEDVGTLLIGQIPQGGEPVGAASQNHRPDPPGSAGDGIDVTTPLPHSQTASRRRRHMQAAPADPKRLPLQQAIRPMRSPRPGQTGGRPPPVCGPNPRQSHQRSLPDSQRAGNPCVDHRGPRHPAMGTGICPRSQRCTWVSIICDHDLLGKCPARGGLT
jgi:hypothetical protein